MARRRMSLLVLAVVLLAWQSIAAGDEPAPAAGAKGAEPAPPPPVFLDDRARGPLTAAQVVAAGNGALAAAYLRTGLQQGLWLAKPARDPRIDKGLLSGIEHRRNIQDANKFEALSYNILVLHAREVSCKDLAAIARKDVFYANLWDDPQRYVGEPVHIAGRMGRLIRIDAPRSLWNDGIKTLYESWVYPIDKDGDNPYCIVFSELPKNAKMGEKVDYQIACDAYFFKLNRYQAKERTNSGRLVRRDAPMFIGRSFVRTGVAPTDASKAESAWSVAAVTHVLPSCVGVVIVMIGLVVGMNWWFRRGDRAVQARIAGTRTFVPPPEDGPAEGPRIGRFGAEE